MKYFALRLFDKHNLMICEVHLVSQFKSIATKLIKSIMNEYNSIECEIYESSKFGYISGTPNKTITLK